MEPHRPQVREDPETLAQAQERALRPLAPRQRIEPRDADGPQQDRVGRARRRERRLRQRLPEALDRRAADRVLLELDRHRGAPGDRLEDLRRLGHDLRTDTVPRKNCDFKQHG